MRGAGLDRGVRRRVLSAAPIALPAACAVAAVVFAFADPGTGRAAQEPDLDLGARLYATQCAACHGVDHDGVDGRGPSLLVEGEGEPVSGGRPQGSVEFVTDGDREVVLRVRSDRPAWLFLSDSMARGWRATVNGKPEPIRFGMIAFRAVPVPEGESTVEFRYEPRWLRIAPVTAGLGVLLLLGMAWWSRRGRPRED